MEGARRGAVMGGTRWRRRGVVVAGVVVMVALVVLMVMVMSPAREQVMAQTGAHGEVRVEGRLARKTMPWPSEREMAVRREVSVLRTLTRVAGDTGPWPLPRLRAVRVTEEELVLVMDVVGDVDARDAALAHAIRSTSDLRAIAKSVAVALGVLHACSVLHNDVKPENIRLSMRNGAAVEAAHLIDFSSCEVGVFWATRGTTVQAGTAEFAAPEAHARHERGFASDWWSFGAALRELGAALNPEPGFNDLVAALLRENPPDRLGSRGDASEVLSHPFFGAGDSTDWSAIANACARHTHDDDDPPLTSTKRLRGRD